MNSTANAHHKTALILFFLMAQGLLSLGNQVNATKAKPLSQTSCFLELIGKDAGDGQTTHPLATTSLKIQLGVQSTPPNDQAVPTGSTNEFRISHSGHSLHRELYSEAKGGAQGTALPGTFVTNFNSAHPHYKYPADKLDWTGSDQIMNHLEQIAAKTTAIRLIPYHQFQHYNQLPNTKVEQIVPVRYGLSISLLYKEEQNLIDQDLINDLFKTWPNVNNDSLGKMLGINSTNSLLFNATVPALPYTQKSMATFRNGDIDGVLMDTIRNKIMDRRENGLLTPTTYYLNDYLDFKFSCNALKFTDFIPRPILNKMNIKK